MTMYWIYDIPNWLLGLVTIVTFVVASIAGLLITRPISRRLLEGSTKHNDVVSYFIAAVGVLYGLALGLIAVATYANYTDVDGKAGKEAASIAALYRDLDSYPPTLRTRLETKLRDYTSFIIKKAWPAHRLGKVPAGGEEILEEFENLVGSYEPVTEGQKIAQTEVMRDVNDVVMNRGFRVQAVDSGLPAVLWGVVLIGAALNIGMMYLFWIDNIKLHAVLIGLFAATLGLLVFLTAAMDNPFRGEFSVSPGAYEEVLERVMKPM
jgi:hypothetical protein